MSHIHVVKRRKGHTEPYDNHKVYASCYSACVNTHIPKEESEQLCNEVTKKVDEWIKHKKETTSQQIFNEVARVMAFYNKDASFMYESHRDIS